MDPFLELFSSAGRANRAWYLWHVILDDLVIGGLTFGLLAFSDVLPVLIELPLAGVAMAGAWAALAITAKRLHDLNRPGWHLLLLLIPLYNFYLGCVLAFVKGTEGDNDYGPDPL